MQGTLIHTSVPSLTLSDGCVPGILQILPEIWISCDIQGFHDGIQFVFGNESKILCQLRKMISAMVQQDQELIWRVLDSPTHGTLLILIGESVGQCSDSQLHPDTIAIHQPHPPSPTTTLDTHLVRRSFLKHGNDIGIKYCKQLYFYI